MAEVPPMEREERLEEIKYEEGFTSRSILGAVFVGLVMMPAAIYLGLLAGQGLTGAAEWVTIILFAEVTRRSFGFLKRQEIYLIYYMAASLTSVMGGQALYGGPFAYKIWDQYFIQTPAAIGMGIAKEVPSWVIPSPGTPGWEAVARRTFLHPAWLVPMGLLFITSILGRMNWIGLGYVLFRMTSDVEKLPFPIAPVAAGGATALADATQAKETWRWHIFSIGSMIGLIFGFFYSGLPALTSTFLTEPLKLIPIPFIDLTRTTEDFLPAAAIGLSTSLGPILTGFVLPFPIVVGIFISSVAVQFICNPLLYKNGVITTWHPGLPTIETKLHTEFDFWMSAGMGGAIAIALVGLYSVVKAFTQPRAKLERRDWTPPPGRGDFPIPLALSLWFISTCASILLCKLWLVPKFPLFWLLFYGLFWTPFNSYISARMFGLMGSGVGFPFFTQGTVVLSRYPKADIWFAPLPLADHGWASQRFRECILTGTKIMSIIKAEILMLPIFFICSFIFWSFFWKLGPIPSALYPYAQTFWPLQATMQSLWMTVNMPGSASKWLFKALKLPVISGGLGAGLLLFIILSACKVSPLYFYGLVGGVGALPHDAIPMFLGAMLGKYYFAKRFGAETWRRYTPVLLAGFACGMGLVTMVCIAIALVLKSVSYLPY